MMSDHAKFIFTIFHEPVEIRMSVRGKARFLRERAFLDDLVGRCAPDDRGLDPERDYYVLDDAQMDAYLSFRQRMRAEERGVPGE
jgi:hypothetical protein